mgnify:CR=1 FL=1
MSQATRSSFVILLFCLAINICLSGFAVQIVGHRGASYTAPENTLASVNLAWKQDADAVEVDVYLTKDGKIVAIHDETTERTAGVDLKVAETDADTLRRLDVGRYKNEKYAREQIPLLEEVIETVPPGKRLFIEIKCGEEILPHLKKVIKSSGKSSQLTIIGFGLDTVAKAKQILPEIPTYWLKGTEKDEETDEYIPHDKNLIQIARDKNLDGLDVNYHGVTREFVDAVKAAGLEIHVWTVNDVEEAGRLAKLGVDSITTDRPGWMKKHLAETGK